MKKIADFLLFGSIFIAICAAALAYETYLLLGLDANRPAIYLFIIGATLVQYNLHYLFKSHPVVTAPTERDTWSANHRSVQKFLWVSGFILIASTVWFLQPRHFGVLAILALLASFYSLPLLPFKKKRLKEYGLLKITLLSLEWTLVTVWFPADQSGVDPTSYWLVFLRRFIFMFVLCLLFDIRDIESDRAGGIRTLPVRYGAAISYRIGDLALLVFLLLSFWQLTHSGNILYFNAMLLSVLCTKWIMQISKKVHNDYVYLFGIDGMMLLQAILVAVGSI